jgi:hypothetical protein
LRVPHLLYSLINKNVYQWKKYSSYKVLWDWISQKYLKQKRDNCGSAFTIEAMAKERSGEDGN